MYLHPADSLTPGSSPDSSGPAVQPKTWLAASSLRLANYSMSNQLLSRLTSRINGMFHFSFQQKSTRPPALLVHQPRRLVHCSTWHAIAHQRSGSLHDHSAIGNISQSVPSLSNHCACVVSVSDLPLANLRWRLIIIPVVQWACTKRARPANTSIDRPMAPPPDALPISKLLLCKAGPVWLRHNCRELLACLDLSTTSSAS